ncbi:excalibur calcium-binding domain-containing protein [Streptomyces sp. NPDC093064]|uniref:excalibur calcium-binding domain-containing protein n=1 Tax=unclassified Streptomyces TaxID=2593676 RepID=UPI003416D9D3
MTNLYTAPARPAPKWARKRYVGPALGLAFILGAGIGSSGSQRKDDAKPAAASPQPTVTVTATAAATPTPEPAPTVTETVTAKPASGSSGGSGSGSSSGEGGSVYYRNCAAARATGAAPVHRGEPGYGPHLDRDGVGYE